MMDVLQRMELKRVALANELARLTHAMEVVGEFAAPTVAPKALRNGDGAGRVLATLRHAKRPMTITEIRAALRPPLSPTYIAKVLTGRSFRRAGRRTGKGQPVLFAVR